MFPIEVYITAYSPGSVGKATDGRGGALGFAVWRLGGEACFACPAGKLKQQRKAAVSTGIRESTRLILSRL